MRLFLFIILLLSTSCELHGQWHLSYGDATGQLITLETTYKLSEPADTGGISGFGERFDLPPGLHLLDSIDFTLSEVNADSIAISIVPAVSVETPDGTRILPDYTDVQAVKRVYSAEQINGGQRVSVDCGRIQVGSSFFVVIVCSGGSLSFLASRRIGTGSLDTAHSAYVFFSTKAPNHILGPYVGLVDEFLVPASEHVDLLFGITYEDRAAVSHSSGTTEANLYPSPVISDKLLHISGIIPKVIRLYDILGRLVTSQIPVHESQGSSVVTVPKLAPGNYTLLIQSNGGVWYSKFIEVR